MNPESSHAGLSHECPHASDASEHEQAIEAFIQGLIEGSRIHGPRPTWFGVSGPSRRQVRRAEEDLRIVARGIYRPNYEGGSDATGAA